MDFGIGWGGRIHIDHRNAALGIHRVELVWLAFVGHHQLGAIGGEGDRIGHNAHGHRTGGGHLGGAADTGHLEEGHLAFGVTGRVSALDGDGHQAAARDRHAIADPSQGQARQQGRLARIGEVNNREGAAAANRQQELGPGVKGTDLGATWKRQGAQAGEFAERGASHRGHMS